MEISEQNKLDSLLDKHGGGELSKSGGNPYMIKQYDKRVGITLVKFSNKMKVPDLLKIFVFISCKKGSVGLLLDNSSHTA